jgi:arylsulfatase A-like enzyme
MTTPVFATLCEVAGLAAPADREIDGLSLMPVLTRTGDLNRESLFWHYPHYRYSDTNQVPQSVIRRGDWKLIRRYDGERRHELFNLREDLSERRDLSALRPDKVAELEAALQTHLKHTGAKMPRPHPDVQF